MERRAVPNVCLVSLGGSKVNELGAMFFGAELWNASARGEGHAVVVRGQDSQGRWRLERTLNGKMWLDIEQKGQPSKWVTLRALRVLKGSAQPDVKKLNTN